MAEKPWWAIRNRSELCSCIWPSVAVSPSCFASHASTPFRALYDDEGPDALEAALETPAEGQEMQVPYRGSVVDILRRIRGHLRSAVSYGGSESLAQLREKVLPDPLRYLVPLSSASRVESYER